MKKLGRVLCYLAAFLSSLTLIRPKGRGALVLGLLKMLAGGCTPLLALMGTGRPGRHLRYGAVLGFGLKMM